MSCLKIFSNNLVEQANISVINENILFPSSNLKDPRRTKVSRSTTSSCTFSLDFLETSEIDSVFIVDEPRNGFGISTISFDFNALPSPVTPAHTESLTFSTKYGLGYKIFNQVDYRYSKINLTSALAYVELSKVFIGKHIDLGVGPNLNWTYQDKELSTIKENRYGQKFTDIISRQKVLNIQLTLLNKDQMDKIFELYDSKGMTKPFFIAIGDDTMINDHRRFSGMVYLNSIPTITNTSFGRYSLSLSLEEAM